MKQELKILKKENQELKKEIERLKGLVTVDPLTRVYNRRAFSHFLQALCREVKWTNENMSKRQRREYFSLLLLDIDDFKKMNDKFGHPYGDKILKQIAKFLQKSVRNFDIVSRWGGEEFAIILQETNLEQAKQRADAILKKPEKNFRLLLALVLFLQTQNIHQIKFLKK